MMHWNGSAIQEDSIVHCAICSKIFPSKSRVPVIKIISADEVITKLHVEPVFDPRSFSKVPVFDPHWLTFIQNQLSAPCKSPKLGRSNMNMSSRKTIKIKSVVLFFFVYQFIVEMMEIMIWMTKNFIRGSFLNVEIISVSFDVKFFKCYNQELRKLYVTRPTTILKSNGKSNITGQIVYWFSDHVHYWCNI